MKSVLSLTFAVVPLLLPTGSAFAGDADRMSLYNPANVETFFITNRSAVAELKVDALQAKDLKATEEKRSKISKRYAAELAKVQMSKLPEKEKNAKYRALDTQHSEALFAAYGEVLRPEQVKRMRQIVAQIQGMGILEHAEVRRGMKIGDKEIKLLQDAYYKWAVERRRELEEDVKAKKITPQEAARRASNYGFSVPKGVRTTLNQEQNKFLDDLLGPKYDYPR
jgi:hypothetical protein